MSKYSDELVETYPRIENLKRATDEKLKVIDNDDKLKLNKNK